MTETIPRQKQAWTYYTPQQRQQVLDLHSKGKSIREIEAEAKVPSSTVHRWLNKLGVVGLRETVSSSVSQVVREAVTQAKSIANQEIEKFLAEQIKVGTLLTSKAKSIAEGKWNRKQAGNLLSVANTAKIGISIARQALGLDQEGSGSHTIRIQNMTVLSRSPDNLSDLEPVQDAEIVKDTVATTVATPVQDPPSP